MRLGNVVESDGKPMSGRCAQRTGYVVRDPEVSTDRHFMQSGRKIQHLAAGEFLKGPSAAYGRNQI
jgi:hypothetical protein